MMRPLRITIIANDLSATEPLQQKLNANGYEATGLRHGPAVLGELFSEPPDILIVELPTGDSKSRALVRNLKEDQGFASIPVLGVVHESLENKVDWEICPVDDFITHPIVYSELFNRLELAMERIQHIFDNNPLSKLPGNTSIQRAVERAFGKSLAVCYLDLNAFKPFNDTFGFVRGDEVIRMVARIMANAVNEVGPGGFAGHVGGDDFVFIVPIDKAETTCQTVIDRFMHILPDVFDDQTRAVGSYPATDRNGQVRRMPLLGLVIAVIPITEKIGHYCKVAERAAELKTYAKHMGGSQYVVDRRRR